MEGTESDSQSRGVEAGHGMQPNEIANHLRATCPPAGTFVNVIVSSAGAQTNASLTTATPGRCIGPLDGPLRRDWVLRRSLFDFP